MKNTPSYKSSKKDRDKRGWTKDILMARVFLIVICFLSFFPPLCFSADVSEELAIRVAENYLEHYMATHEEWGGSNNPTIADYELVVYNDEPLAYNFNVNPKGHLLVAFHDEFSPVLLYSDTSEFVPERADEIGYIESWIIPEIYASYKALQEDSDNIRAQISYSETRVAQAWNWLDETPAAFSTNAEEYGYRSATVGPLLTTSWAQGSPYNQNTPGISGSCTHTVTGCVATAWAQLMKYWNWPDRGTGSHSYSWNGTTLSANFNHDYYWSSMPNQLTGSSTTTQKNAVGRLMSDAGISADMNYGCGTSGSNAYANDVLDVYFKYKNTMQLLRRTSYTASQWINLFKAELNASPARPIVLSIWNTAGGGHEVIADGYQTGATDKIHINFGWSGSYNGYYDINHNYTTGSHTWTTNSHIIVTHIEPLGGSKPGKATLVSPSSNTLDTTPTYTWNKVSNATWYYLWVKDSTGKKIDKWYTSASVCSGSTCSVTPSTVLANGNATWWIRTWNTAGLGPWSDAMGFSVGRPIPSKATLISPSGTTTDTTPTYRWNVADNATWYYLWVNDATGKKIGKWYTASVCSGSTCSVTPSTVLASGNGAWWIRTWNSTGYGPWSNGMNFQIPNPAAATLISPKGTITDSTPTYRWEGASGATWYRLWVNDATGNKINKWYTASSVCSGLTCSETPATKLANGNGIWWVQTFFPKGFGPWSPGLNFEVADPTGGFNSQFNGNMKGWYRPAGTPPWNYDSSYIFTSGAKGKLASTFYGSVSDSKTMYGDFDYSVKLWRAGSDFDGSGVLFRGKPNPLTSIYVWDEGYYFQYTRKGTYSILLIKNGVITTLKGWTGTSAIHRGSAWNVLRVYAKGTTLYFYINGKYVATVINSSLSTGKAGFAMYNTDGTAGDKIWADYAVLKPVTATTLNIAEEAVISDGVIIDEAMIISQNGESSDGDLWSDGDYSSDLLLETTAPESVPEVQLDAQGPDS